MHLFEILRRTAAKTPDAPAIVDAHGEPTANYAELLDGVLRRAAHLAALGIGNGDRIAVFDQNGGRFLEAYFAIAAVGAISVPLNLRLAPPETAAILLDAEAKLLLVGADLAVATAVPQLALPKLGTDYEALSADVFGGVDRAPDAIAHLYYTSGTTGTPKGVILTHGNVSTHARAACAELDLTGADTWAHIAPMFHLADAWATFALTIVGGRHAFLPRFDAAAALRLLDTAGITCTNLVPTMLNGMVHHPAIHELQFASLRLLLSGGAPIAPAVVEKILDRFGCDYVQTYGMTETSPYLTLSLLHDHLRELPAAEQLQFKCKTGRPFRGIELRVVDADGTPVPPDDQTPGEIQVRGATVTPGYWRQPAATRAAFTADGFLRTGDLATLDAEGYIDIVDRKKDVILTGGETVYSIEVENVLYRHEHVVEAAVFGRPDAEWGEIVCAAVVTTQPVPDDALDAFCRRALAGYKVPRSYEHRDTLPRTGSGKIAKRLLRAESTDRHAT